MNDGSWLSGSPFSNIALVILQIYVEFIKKFFSFDASIRALPRRFTSNVVSRKVYYYFYKMLWYVSWINNNAMIRESVPDLPKRYTEIELIDVRTFLPAVCLGFLLACAGRKTDRKNNTSYRSNKTVGRAAQRTSGPSGLLRRTNTEELPTRAFPVSDLRPSAVFAWLAF